MGLKLSLGLVLSFILYSLYSDVGVKEKRLLSLCQAFSHILIRNISSQEVTLCKLNLHTLAADVPGGFSWIKPGADHKVRLMSKVLYA